MPLVSKPKSFACRGERLARTGTGPQGAVVGHPGESQSVRPYSDSSEEMALRVVLDIVRSDIFDTPFVDVARSYVPRSDQIAKPLRGVWIDLVVVSSHAAPGFFRQNNPMPCRGIPHKVARCGSLRVVLG